MHGGTWKAWAGQRPPIGDTLSQGKGPEDKQHQGIASVAIYRETLNDTTGSKINQFANRAAAALGCRKSDMIMEDSSGRRTMGQATEWGGTVSQDQPYLKTASGG